MAGTKPESEGSESKPKGAEPHGEDEPQPGDPAPPLTLDKVLQAPEGARATWSALKGRAVVVEFWATWCGPCIRAIPHLNELARKLDGEPIQFLMITDEREALVKKFLAKRPLEGWIGLDPDRSTFEDYEVQGIPCTLLVDREGIVRARTDPDVVTEASLRALIKGEDPGLPRIDVARQVSALHEQESGSQPLFQVMVRPSTSEVSMMSTSGSGCSIVGFPVEDIMANVYGVSRSRLVFDRKPPKGNFDVQALFGRRPDLRDSLLRQAVEAAFGIRPRTERRTMDVFELVGRPELGGSLVKGSGSGGGYRTMPGRFEGTNLGGKGIARALESALQAIVVDRSGLRGEYDVDLKWDAARPDTLFEALKTTGLELRRSRRSVEVLVVK